ncbi:MAG: hypothetical protein Rubg2KO_25720 [Rubricoccaceae bacterium]
MASGGNYKETVMRHLMEIQSFPVGRALFTALSMYGKRQNILYGGPSNNQAAGSAMGYKLLRKYHDASSPMFKDELASTMQRGRLDRAALAHRLTRQMLYTWAGGRTPSPFMQRGPGQKASDKIGEWLAGTSRPTNDEMDVLMLVLEPYLKSGPGVGTRINYDPAKEITQGQRRPPQVALFHELIHAYYNAGGNQLGREDSAAEGNGGRLFELMAVGLPPFDDRQFSENKLREAWPGCSLRGSYP